jgi:hypothetical protein
MPPQFGPPAAGFPQTQQSQQQSGILPRSAVSQTSQSQMGLSQQQPNPVPRPSLPATQHQNGPPAHSLGTASTTSAAQKGPGGSIYNVNPPAQRGTPNMPPDLRGPSTLNDPKLPFTTNSALPPRPESPRGRPISPRYDPRDPTRYDASPE